MKQIQLYIFFLLTATVSLHSQTWEAQRLEIGALQSTTVAEPGDFYVSLSHRLASFTTPDSNFFKWDYHNTNLELVYGLWNGLQVGLSWEALRDTYSASAKMVLLQQSDGSPIDMTAYGVIHWNGELSKERYPFMKEADRLSYTSQILIGKHFSEKLFFEIAPTFIRQNLVWEKIQNHNQFAIGFGSRFQLADRASIFLDYVAHLNRNKATVYNNPMTVGIDFNIKKMLLGVSVSNAHSFNDAGVISNGEGDWSNGDVYLALNLIKVF